MEKIISKCFSIILFIVLGVAIYKNLQILAVVSLVLLPLGYERLQTFLNKILEKIENSVEGSLPGISWKIPSPKAVENELEKDSLSASQNVLGTNVTEVPKDDDKSKLLAKYNELRGKLFSMLCSQEGLFPNQKSIFQRFEVGSSFGKRLIIDGSINTQEGKLFLIELKLTDDYKRILEAAMILSDFQLRANMEIIKFRNKFFGREMTPNCLIISLNNEKLPDEILGIPIIKFDLASEKFVNLDKVKKYVE